MSDLTSSFDIPQKVGDVVRVQLAAVQVFNGGAAAVVVGTGYATPLRVATAGHQLIGVFLDDADNRLGTPGTLVEGAPLSQQYSWTRVARSGTFRFNQSGITQAAVGRDAYFSDDNTVTLTPGAIYAGRVVTVDEDATKVWVDIGPAVVKPYQMALQPIAASGAVAPRTSASYVITKAGVAALTLAAPTATTDDGTTIVITSSTANAHTLTATGLLQPGTSAVNVATFAAQPGAGLTLVAYQGKWNVLASVGITFS